MRNALLLLSVAIWAVACGDNINPGTTHDAAVDDAGSIDAPTDAGIDAPICPQRPAGTPGGPCTTDAQCDSATGAGDGFCLNNTLDIAPWPAQGYCMTKLGTCAVDGDCGAGNVCVILDEGTPDEVSACFAGCAADPCACPTGMVCGTGYAGSDVGRMICVPGNSGAIDGAECDTFGDCDLSSICLADGFEAPGGQCMQVGCTVGTDATCTTGGDGHCGPSNVLGGGTGCLDRCTTNADCRTVDGYVCYDAGGTTGKYCRHPATGDVCAVDADCGATAVWDCRTGAKFPGGYCTVQAACNIANPANSGCSPGSSVCGDPDGAGAGAPYCVDRCATAGVQSTCRPGYTCLDVNPSPTVTNLGCVVP